MAEKEEVYSSKISYNGIFSFKDLYKFCHDWLVEETGVSLSEDKYSEKIKGDSKDITVEWKGTKEMTDYFKMEIKVSFKVSDLKNVEVMQGNVKISTNKGSVEISVKGTLVRDYEDKFEGSGFKKFLRETYEKYIIHDRVLQYKEKVASSCDEFLSQTKAYLDLEAKKK
ncbi:MAG: hypothetical protein KatS3mg001_047 [Candidatus Pacearchaeota archaeon]|nr:MAG: hypothetical protein KatS3mg001_047 [Candidatus Pacearchaeota archaeon]